MEKELKYQRILLKLSGESMAGPEGFGVDPHQAENMARYVQEIIELGVEVAIVIGAGNIWRGQLGLERGMERATADYMGMLATVINAMALMDAMERSGIVTRVLSAIEMSQVAEPYIRRRAIRHLEKGRVVIFGGGTGNPYFTNPDAKRFDRLTYIETLNRRLEVMDSTAISLCMDNNLPILVLNLWAEGVLRQALFGHSVGTLVTS
jgi:uridylate kinase